MAKNLLDERGTIQIIKKRKFPGLYEMFTEYVRVPDLKMLCTFDHLTAGYPSRILVSYMMLERYYGSLLDQTLSVVLDCIVPKREIPAGSHLHFGFLTDASTTIVEDPEVFFFKATMKPIEMTPLLEESERLLYQYIKGQTGYPAGYCHRLTAVALGKLTTVLYFYKHLSRPNYLVRIREQVDQLLGVSIPRVKKQFDSRLMPLFADMLDALRNDGFAFYALPPSLASHGVFRLVTEEGRDGGIVLYNEDDGSFTDVRGEAHSLDELIDGVRSLTVLPTAPTTILLSTVLPQIPHFGNQYGIVNELAEWAGIDATGLNVMPDHFNSFPAGSIILEHRKIRREIVNVLLDYLHFSPDEYLSHLNKALQTGEPQFSLRLGDVRAV